ncbi:hypothetical protein PoMZ_10070 [Pyricularia oryzae]|uniref:Uncharacterized protein n=1 Tax=Pyricularia oryzae TaxID=318829 RepID=A0A4P7MZ69_PYROR|nr:hypothetical protein PoMZ_10070 [Pyricularia oryzae]
MYTQTLYLPFSFSFAGSIFQLKHCRGRKWNPPPVLAEDSGARTTSSNPHPAGPSQCKLNGQAFRGGAAMGVCGLSKMLDVQGSTDGGEPLRQIQDDFPEVQSTIQKPGGTMENESGKGRKKGTTK